MIKSSIVCVVGVRKSGILPSSVMYRRCALNLRTDAAYRYVISVMSLIDQGGILGDEILVSKPRVRVARTIE